MASPTSKVSSTDTQPASQDLQSKTKSEQDVKVQISVQGSLPSVTKSKGEANFHALHNFYTTDYFRGLATSKRKWGYFSETCTFDPDPPKSRLCGQRSSEDPWEFRMMSTNSHPRYVPMLTGLLNGHVDISKFILKDPMIEFWKKIAEDNKGDAAAVKNMLKSKSLLSLAELLISGIPKITKVAFQNFGAILPADDTGEQAHYRPQAIFRTDDVLRIRVIMWNTLGTHSGLSTFKWERNCPMELQDSNIKFQGSKGKNNWVLETHSEANLKDPSTPLPKQGDGLFGAFFIFRSDTDNIPPSPKSTSRSVSVSIKTGTTGKGKHEDIKYGTAHAVNDLVFKTAFLIKFQVASYNAHPGKDDVAMTPQEALTYFNEQMDLDEQNMRADFILKPEKSSCVIL